MENKLVFKKINYKIRFRKFYINIKFNLFIKFFNIYYLNPHQKTPILQTHFLSAHRVF